MTPENHAAQIRTAVVYLQAEIDAAVDADLTVTFSSRDEFRGRVARKAPVLTVAITKEL